MEGAACMVFIAYTFSCPVIATKSDKLTQGILKRLHFRSEFTLSWPVTVGVYLPPRELV